MDSPAEHSCISDEQQVASTALEGSDGSEFSSSSHLGQQWRKSVDLEREEPGWGSLEFCLRNQSSTSHESNEDFPPSDAHTGSTAELGSRDHPDTALNPLAEPFTSLATLSGSENYAVHCSPRGEPSSPSDSLRFEQYPYPLYPVFENRTTSHAWESSETLHTREFSALPHASPLAQSAELHDEAICNTPGPQPVAGPSESSPDDVLEHKGSSDVFGNPRGGDDIDTAEFHSANPHLSVSPKQLFQRTMHESVIKSLRETMYEEVVRALQRLTAIPLEGSSQSKQYDRTAASTQLKAHEKKSGFAGDSEGPAAAVKCTGAVRKSEACKADPEVAQLATSSALSTSGRTTDATVLCTSALGTNTVESGVIACDEPQLGRSSSHNAERTSYIILMDKRIAQGHADTITSQTHKAFQRLDENSADGEAVGINYCKAIMVDVLVVTSAWRHWAAAQGCHSVSAQEQLSSEHARALDAVHDAVTAECSGGKCLGNLDDFEGSSKCLMSSTDRALGLKSSCPVAEDVVQVDSSLQHSPGVLALSLASAPWAVSAGQRGYYLEKAQEAIVRMLRCATEAGSALVFMPGQFLGRSNLSCFAHNRYVDPVSESYPPCSGLSRPSGVSAAMEDGPRFSDPFLSPTGTTVSSALCGPSDMEPPPIITQVLPGSRSEPLDDHSATTNGHAMISGVSAREQAHGHFEPGGTAPAASAYRDTEADQARLHVSRGDFQTRPWLRHPRSCLSPSAVPPASMSFVNLVSPDATPCGRKPRGKCRDELLGSKPQILGMLVPLHPLLVPVTIREPGIALGCALPNEANQHLTLTQQDGSEPLWRAAMYSSEVAQSGLYVGTVLDSRVAYVHCIVGPPSSIMSTSPGHIQTRPRSMHLTTDDLAQTLEHSDVPDDVNLGPSHSLIPSHLNSSGIYLNGKSNMCDAKCDSGFSEGSAREAYESDTDRFSVMVSAWALTGVSINNRHIAHNECDLLKDGETLTIVPQSSAGPALSYIFRAGDPSVALITPHVNAASCLPPLHSVSLCQICGDLPRDCLVLRPCGHTFCATCLSHRFAAELAYGSYLTCPHGCPRPETIDRCADVDAMVESLPEYLPRLARVMDWHSDVRSSREEPQVAANTLPRSPNWAGTSSSQRIVRRTSSMHRRSCIPQLHSDDAVMSTYRTPETSTFQRFVHSLGPPVASAACPASGDFRHSDPGVGAPVLRSPAVRHDCTSTDADVASTQRSSDTVVPFSATGRSSQSGTNTGSESQQRPASISELVPLSKEMTPLPMQEIYAQQADVSARLIKATIETDFRVANLSQMVRHLYVLMHAVKDGPLWKEELNRSGTVEDAATIIQAAVRGAKGGQEPHSLAGSAGRHVFCAAVSLLCALVLAQLPGSEEVCQGNQWRAARVQVVETLVESFEVWPSCHFTCHAALQCLVVLCKDNAMMKANMTVIALKPVLKVLQHCGHVPVIAERGFTLLAVLQAGGDHLNDGIRRLLAENGLQKASIRALQQHCSGEERALTAVCFSVAMILRGGERWRETIRWKVATSSLPRAITAAEKAYRSKCTRLGIPHDEALAALLAFLVLYLEPIKKRVGAQRTVLSWICRAALALAAARVSRHLRATHN